ncbi:MAG: endonuclease/exonuclease/phosphatase family protein [Phycisphaerales bacterium]
MLVSTTPFPARLGRFLSMAAICAALLGPATIARAQAEPDGDQAIRVATFNILDVSTSDLLDEDNPRLQRVAEVLQRLRPNIVLVNEIAYDHHGVPGVPTDRPEGSNAQRFIDRYLAQPQAPGLAPLRYRAVMLPSNTGQASGLDLDNSGQAVTTYPVPARSDAAGNPPRQTEDGRAYGNDCWGFGTYPGQYAMALLVDERLEVLQSEIRSFRLLPWSAMPDARRPMLPDGTPWYNDEAWEAMRLSSKSHWDVPVRLPNGAVVHFLCSHPTPPAFDGEEGRNKARNHDEIRFWDDYLDNRAWIADDRQRIGGLERGRFFVILGDLNADPEKGNDVGDPIGRLLRNPRVQSRAAPVHQEAVEGLAPSDTADFGLRVDYVIPSRGLGVVRSGVWTIPPAPRGGSSGFPSDHFPVWVELSVPPP